MKSLPLFCKEELSEEKKWILDYVSGSLTEPPKSEGELYLSYQTQGLSLVEVGRLNPLRVDFLEGELRQKRKRGVGKSSLLGKALGVQKGNRKIFDATLGLGQDAWMFLCMGLSVQGVERSAAVYALTREAWERALQDEDLAQWAAGRLDLRHADSFELLSKPIEADVIYMDFMFDEKKKGLPRKSMQLLHKLDLNEPRASELAEKALKSPISRLVIKRPLRADFVFEKPQHVYPGNSIRYDVYIGKKRGE